MTQWEPSDKIAAVSAACAILVLALGVWQYISSERWKRSEFVAAQLKDFNSDKINTAVLRMMDYDPARVELFPHKRDSEKRYVQVKSATLVSAINKSMTDLALDDTEFEVLQYFEYFMRTLSRFDYFLKSGAIAPNELCADFEYPVGLMNGDQADNKRKITKEDIGPFVKVVDKYINTWQSPDVKDFMDKIKAACNTGRKPK